MEGCTWGGLFIWFRQEMQEFATLGMLSGTSCILSMLSGVYMWSHDQPTHGLAQYCGKIVYPPTPFITCKIWYLNNIVKVNASVQVQLLKTIQQWLKFRFLKKQIIKMKFFDIQPDL